MFLLCRSTSWRTVLVTGLTIGAAGFSSFTDLSFAAGFSCAAGFSWATTSMAANKTTGIIKLIFITIMIVIGAKRVHIIHLQGQKLHAHEINITTKVNGAQR